MVCKSLDLSTIKLDGDVTIKRSERYDNISLIYADSFTLCRAQLSICSAVVGSGGTAVYMSSRKMPELTKYDGNIADFHKYVGLDDVHGRIFDEYIGVMVPEKTLYVDTTGRYFIDTDANYVYKIMRYATDLSPDVLIISDHNNFIEDIDQNGEDRRLILDEVVDLIGSVTSNAKCAIYIGVEDNHNSSTFEAEFIEYLKKDGRSDERCRELYRQHMRTYRIYRP